MNADDRKMTDHAVRVIDGARKVADTLGHSYVGTEHLLLALVIDDGIASGILKRHGLTEFVIGFEFGLYLPQPPIDEPPTT